MGIVLDFSRPGKPTDNAFYRIVQRQVPGGMPEHPTQTGLLKREELVAKLRARTDVLPIRQWPLTTVDA